MTRKILLICGLAVLPLIVTVALVISINRDEVCNKYSIAPSPYVQIAPGSYQGSFWTASVIVDDVLKKDGRFCVDKLERPLYVNFVSKEPFTIDSFVSRAELPLGYPTDFGWNSRGLKVTKPECFVLTSGVDVKVAVETLSFETTSQAVDVRVCQGRNTK